VVKGIWRSLYDQDLIYFHCPPDAWVWISRLESFHVDRIECVQNNFLLFALRCLNWDANLILPSYSSRLLLINLPCVANRRIMLGSVFIYSCTTNSTTYSSNVWIVTLPVFLALSKHAIPFWNGIATKYQKVFIIFK